MRHEVAYGEMDRQEKFLIVGKTTRLSSAPEE
jgi:hypothetical protein